MSLGFLAVGYVLALPPLFRLWRVWRKRLWWAYAIEASGAALITIGWLMRGGRPSAVIINGAWALLWGFGFPIWAIWSRRRAADGTDESGYHTPS